MIAPAAGEPIVLGPDFFERRTLTVARQLIGKYLVRRSEGQDTAVMITETEAYDGPRDKASHAYRGHTPRNAPMFRGGGTIYVYFTYGMHYCLNVVAQTHGHPTACLIRALQPVEGLELMRRNRTGKIDPARLKDTNLCSGPAKLAQALAIDRSLDGADLVTGEKLFIERAQPVADEHIVAAPRIGVAYAGEWADKPLRFYEKDNPHVSVRSPGA